MRYNNESFGIVFTQQYTTGINRIETSLGISFVIYYSVTSHTYWLKTIDNFSGSWSGSFASCGVRWHHWHGCIKLEASLGCLSSLPLGLCLHMVSHFLESFYMVTISSKIAWTSLQLDGWVLTRTVPRRQIPMQEPWLTHAE